MRLTARIILTAFLTILTANLTAGDYSVVNKSGVTVTNISVSFTGANSWNSVYSSWIQKEEKIKISIPAGEDNCSFEIKFRDESGKEYRMNDVNLCGSSEIILDSGNPVQADKIIIHPKSK